jgi:hypothetical protein
MANLLQQLELDELSLVDRPANAQAMVSLFKRDNSYGEDMNEETTEKSYEAEMKVACADCATADGGVCASCGEGPDMMETPEMAKADEVTTETEVDKAEEVEVKAVEVDKSAEEIASLKLENERLRKALIENGYVIKAEAIEKKAQADFIEYDGEKINKSDIPAPILKALEAAEIAKADLELTKKAQDALPNFALTAAKELVKSFWANEEIMGALKAADKAFSASMEEVGKADVDGEFTTATDKLDALVKSFMDTNEMKKSEYARAYAAVAKTEEGKALINKTYKGE